MVSGVVVDGESGVGDGVRISSVVRTENLLCGSGLRETRISFRVTPGLTGRPFFGVLLKSRRYQCSRDWTLPGRNPRSG